MFSSTQQVLFPSRKVLHHEVFHLDGEIYRDWRIDPLYAGLKEEVVRIKKENAARRSRERKTKYELLATLSYDDPAYTPLLHELLKERPMRA